MEAPFCEFLPAGNLGLGLGRGGRAIGASGSGHSKAKTEREIRDAPHAVDPIGAAGLADAAAALPPPWSKG